MKVVIDTMRSMDQTTHSTQPNQHPVAAERVWKNGISKAFDDWTNISDECTNRQYKSHSEIYGFCICHWKQSLLFKHDDQSHIWHIEPAPPKPNLWCLACLRKWHNTTLHLGVLGSRWLFEQRHCFLLANAFLLYSYRIVHDRQSMM